VEGTGGLVMDVSVEQQTMGPLFGRFWPLTFAQPHSRAAAVLVDEFDAGGFQRAADRSGQVCPLNFGSLELFL
jgi:hypothetical protein